MSIYNNGIGTDYNGAVSTTDNHFFRFKDKYRYNRLKSTNGIVKKTLNYLAMSDIVCNFANN